jgi:biotin-dependent carboxylase-like uncharacterized protein
MLEVVRPGPLTTVQDAGRRGVAALGVPRAGALDQPAYRCANALVGNAPGAAALEATTGKLALRALGGDTWVAVTGAPAPVRVGGRAAAWGAPVRVRDGELVEVGPVTAGVRCYLALDGGLAVPAVLGSRSADLLAGLGPLPLAAGDRLPLGPPGTIGPGGSDGVPLAAPPAELVLRLAPGPRRDWFEPESLAGLARARYRVSSASNRVGLRLTDGPPLRRREGLGELPSEGMVLGAVQVPPDGMPVVFLADHPTTGGYPVVGVVPEADLAAAAQALPGTPVRLLPTVRLDV